LLLCLSCAGNAQVYRWTDSEGRTHYGDRPSDARTAKPVAARPSEAAAADEVQVLETAVEWFTIHGHSPQQMRDSMQQTAPYNELAGSKVWGQCRWWFEWDFKYRVEQGSCNVGSFSIVLHSQMQLPRWVDASGAPAELRSRWEDFARRLRQHEDGHKANGVRAANDLARRIRALPAFADCDALNDAIVIASKRVTSEGGMLDAAFDRVDRLYLTGF
jgi:predicted secreted Zn-dependent protease